LRLEGRWFKASRDYRKSVDARLKALPNLSAELSLPHWKKAVHADEGKYNTYVASQKKWLLQDQVWLHPGDGARVEPCDLLTPEGHFIHVKSGDRASSIHHQLGQLSGAASLLSRHEPTKKDLSDRYAAKWPKSKLLDQHPKFVMAIGRRGTCQRC
jgi:uncharacterized protein (TIGR04141 family)